MKKISYLISFILIFFYFLSNSSAETVVFTNYSSQVSGLELDLALFDLKVNYLNILPQDQFQFLTSIRSVSTSQTQIFAWVWVSPSLMNGSLKERQKRLDDLCNNLFKEYQEKFLMIDQDYKKKSDEDGIPALHMKPCNLMLAIWTNGNQSKYLAEWKCGSLSYNDNFLKE
jgi:hypothetical protein